MFFRYKSECVIDVDPNTAFKYVEPVSDGPRGQWDKAVKSLEVVRKIDEVCYRIFTIVRCPFPSNV